MEMTGTIAEMAATVLKVKIEPKKNDNKYPKLNKRFVDEMSLPRIRG